MKRRETINLVLHINLGLIFTALVLYNTWFLIPVTFVYAWLREQAQHRYKLETVLDPIRQMEVQYATKTTFFGWMTGHRIFEVFQWVIGATTACVVWHFFG